MERTNEAAEIQWREAIIDTNWLFSERVNQTIVQRLVLNKQIEATLSAAIRKRVANETDLQKSIGPVILIHTRDKLEQTSLNTVDQINKSLFHLNRLLGEEDNDRHSESNSMQEKADVTKDDSASLIDAIEKSHTVYKQLMNELLVTEQKFEDSIQPLSESYSSLSEYTTILHNIKDLLKADEKLTLLAIKEAVVELNQHYVSDAGESHEPDELEKLEDYMAKRIKQLRIEYNMIEKEELSKAVKKRTTYITKFQVTRKSNQLNVQKLNEESKKLDKTEAEQTDEYFKYLVFEKCKCGQDMLNWHFNGTDEVVWANPCDFYGNDRMNIQWTINSSCGRECVARPWCTHYTKVDKRGICYLKEGSFHISQVKFQPGENIFCGFLKRAWFE